MKTHPINWNEISILPYLKKYFGRNANNVKNALVESTLVEVKSTDNGTAYLLNFPDGTVAECEICYEPTRLTWVGIEEANDLHYFKNK